MARSKNFAPSVADQGPIVDDEVGRLFESAQARDAQPRLRDLPVERIEPNPFQARHEFTDIDELAQSIRVHGFTSRLRVRPHADEAGRFQLVYGERRLRAAIMAGLLRVPVEILAHSDDQMIEIGLAENIQRQALTPIEEAKGLQVLMERRGYSQRMLAERLGKTAGYVQNRIDLLRAPEDVQQLVAQRPDSLRAARSIARLPDPAQRQPLIAALVSDALSGDDVVVRVREILERPASVETPAPPPLTSMAAEGHDVWALAGDAPATSDVIPARSAKEPRPAARPGGRSATRASAMARILETDALRIDVMLSRWRQALAGADGDERRSFALYLRNHLEPQLAALRLAVEDDEIGEDSAACGRV